MSKKKNKKNNKKNTAVELAMVCGMLGVNPDKDFKDLCKDAPLRYRKDIKRLGKNDKIRFAMAVGYYIANHAPITIDNVFQDFKPADGGNYSPLEPYAKAVEEHHAAMTEEPMAVPSEDDQKEEDTHPEEESCQKHIGSALVNSMFKLSSGNNIISCCVYDGKLTTGSKARVYRNNELIHEGTITNLKRFGRDVAEVETGFDFGVTIEGYTDVRKNDIVECFEAETVEESTQGQFTAPKFIDGGYFKILVTDVDTDSNTLTYLDLGEYRNTTPAIAPTALSAIGAICEEDHRKLAEEFGIDPEYIANGVGDARAELPTQGQLELLKDMYDNLNLNDDTLKEYLFANPLLMCAAFEEDGCRKSRTVLMPNGQLAKRQSNWHAVLVPSVTIEF